MVRSLLLFMLVKTFRQVVEPLIRPYRSWQRQQAAAARQKRLDCTIAHELYGFKIGLAQGYEQGRSATAGLPNNVLVEWTAEQYLERRAAEQFRNGVVAPARDWLTL